MDESYKVIESGLSHSTPMPERQAPTDDMVPREMLKGAFLGWRHDHKRLLSDEAQPPYQDLWFKANGAVPDDPVLHAALAVFESDNALLGTARMPHRDKMNRAKLQMASLDHAMWFHRPFRADEWLLYQQTALSSSSARGLAGGSLFTSDGALVVNVVQEGLIRVVG